MEFNVNNILRAYKIAEGVGTVIDNRKKLKRAFEFHQKGSDILLEVADTATRVANNEVTDEDVRKVAKLAYDQRGRVYRAVAKIVQKSRQRQKRK